MKASVRAHYTLMSRLGEGKPELCAFCVIHRRFFVREDVLGPGLGLVCFAESPPRDKNPPSSRASFAALEMHFQRSEPSMTPPCHLNTTTMTSSHWLSSSKRRSPAPASPPLEDPMRTMPALWLRSLHAYIACEARRVRGSMTRRCASKSGATSAFMTEVSVFPGPYSESLEEGIGAAYPWNIDLRWVSCFDVARPGQLGVCSAVALYCLRIFANNG